MSPELARVDAFGWGKFSLIRSTLVRGVRLTYTFYYRRTNKRSYTEPYKKNRNKINKFISKENTP